MNRLVAIVPGFFAMTLVAWTTSGHHMISDPECKECDEEICNNDNMLGFVEGSDDVLTPCPGSPSCCVETAGSCGLLIPCPQDDDDLDYDSVEEFATKLPTMPSEELQRLIVDHPDHFAYFAPRRAVLVMGCSHSLKAVLPLTSDQLTALEAADL